MKHTTVQPGAYPVSSSDRLWLARAVQAESSDSLDRARVAQALVNRFAFLRARDPKLFPTLGTFVQAYSQPVNPRWMRGGDRWEAAYKRATNDRVRRSLELTAEKRARAARRTAFDATTEAAVARALELGPVDLPSPAATDFQAPHRSTPTHLVRLTEHAQGHNTYYRVKGPHEWPGYAVDVARVSAWGAVVLACGAAWAVVRRKKVRP